MEDPLPGFRFYPTEEELVSFYLQNKLRGTRTDIDRVIPTVDIYDYNPEDLPGLAGELCPEDSEQWFFFLLRQEREARGGRPNRLTTEGYWKATGSPGDVYSSRNNSVIGRKRTMVFYVGRAPNGNKTYWKMNEYKVIESPDQASSSSSAAPNPQIREELSLCRIYKRSRNLRSFDRRPPSELARGDQAAVNPQHHDNDAATAAAVDYQLYDGPMVPEWGDWSLESSPGRHTAANPSPSGDNENNPGTATADSEPWWDSDQFHWFDI